MRLIGYCVLNGRKSGIDTMIEQILSRLGKCSRYINLIIILNRFCEVEQDGNISKEDRGTKICSSKIKIKAELKLADMINLGIEWLKEITLPEKIKTSIKDNSSGNNAKIGSSGNNAKIDSTGKDCVIMCAGINSVAKASKGSWIALSEWSYSEGKQRYIPICVKTEFVDGEKIKADTYYSLKGGVFVEWIND